MKGIIDRVVEGVAVILLQPDERDELHLAEKYLPEDAGEGSVLSFTIEVDHSETEARKERVGNLIDRLKDKQE